MKKSVLLERLEQLRQLMNSPDGTYEHNHTVMLHGNVLSIPCPDEEQFGCFIDNQIIFQLGSSREITQANLGKIYASLLGFIMDVAYGLRSSEDAMRSIEKITKEWVKSSKLIDDL